MAGTELLTNYLSGISECHKRTLNMFGDLAVFSDVQLQRGEGVCDPNTFLSQINSGSGQSN